MQNGSEHKGQTQDAPVDPLIDELPSRYVIGIDLGTTNSAVTWIDTEERPWQIRVLAIEQLVAVGETELRDTLPSFHYQPPQSLDLSALKMPWDDKAPTACVGVWARDEMAKTSGRGISSAKSWLCHAAVDRTAPLLPWQAAADVKRHSPVEISAAYLSHIRQCWDRQFPDAPLSQQDIVLTLPASFDEVARALTIEAAAQAGLKRIVLIEEPQAAFYAWVNRFSKDGADHWQSSVKVGQKILVCDIGGGTTDMTLIRVRSADAGADENASDEATQAAAPSAAQRIQFHRVAVGNHLILGGDNLDLAIAKHVEAKLTSGGQLEPAQWDHLLGSSRTVKEKMLSSDAPQTMSISLPSRGAKLIAGSTTAEVSRDEIRELVIEGFLPQVALTERPEYHASGFQEFGLPYASDPAVTRYVADFLTQHAGAGSDSGDAQGDSAHPDIILFNGGFFASDLLRQTLVQQVEAWFRPSLGPSWSPQVLENDRLDLAVARGAAYYGMVRRDEGVRIAAALARSYYIEIGDGKAVCIMPGNAQPGQSFQLEEQTFLLTISQPVEFSIHVSSIRLADAPGQIVDVDPQQLRSLPPIRTVLKVRSRNEKRAVAVKMQVTLTELGTIDLSCHEVDADRSWKLQFDVRSTTQTDLVAHQADGEMEGFVDEATWEACRAAIEGVFVKGSPDSLKPNQLVRSLAKTLDAERAQWPMSVLRRIWETLMEVRDGRRISPSHEARWLNLLGYCLRPGYGMALDDWRVTETWRHVRGKLIHNGANIQTESLILWRRLSGGLSAGQQTALAQPLLAALRSLASQFAGKVVKGNAIAIKPEDSAEAWRLLGALELLPTAQKIELGDLIIAIKGKKRLAKALPAMTWALGRLGQRKPLYGPLNTVVPATVAAAWSKALMEDRDGAEVFPVVQMCHRTGDRYRDVDDGLRGNVLKWLVQRAAAEELVMLVRDGGDFKAEQKSQVFGESLPQGLRLV